MIAHPRADEQRGHDNFLSRATCNGRRSRCGPVTGAMLIDEMPAIAGDGRPFTAAAWTWSGAGELRGRTTRKIAVLVAGFRALGIRLLSTRLRTDGFTIGGTSRAAQGRRGALRTPAAITHARGVRDSQRSRFAEGTVDDLEGADDVVQLLSGVLSRRWSGLVAPRRGLARSAVGVR